MINQVLLTCTDLDCAEVIFVQSILSSAMDVEIQTFDWNHFRCRLLDPYAPEISLNSVLYVVLIRFEDWDHFRDHARNPTVEPSYDMVASKVHDLIFAIDCAAGLSDKQFLIAILSPSEMVSNVVCLMDFFSRMTHGLEDSLTHHAKVRVVSLPDIRVGDAYGLESSFLKHCTEVQHLFAD